MQRLEHTSVWWEQRGGRVIFFRKLRFAVAFQLVFGLAVVYAIGLLVAPVYLVGKGDAAAGWQAVSISLVGAAAFGTLAFLMRPLIRRDPHVFIRRRSLQIGAGLRLLAIREDVVLPTGMGGTMQGGNRLTINVQSGEQPRLRVLCRATAEPDLHAINCILSRRTVSGT